MPEIMLALQQSIKNFHLLGIIQLFHRIGGFEYEDNWITEEKAAERESPSNIDDGNFMNIHLEWLRYHQTWQLYHWSKTDGDRVITTCTP